MNKISLFIITVIFFYSCSYEPMMVGKLQFQFDIINTSGEKEINEIIKQKLVKKSKGDKVYNIKFITKKDKLTISSNEKGDPTVFELSVNLNYEIYNENSLLNKNIIQKKITYNNIKDKFELLKYEENIIKVYLKILAMKYLDRFHHYKNDNKTF